MRTQAHRRELDRLGLEAAHVGDRPHDGRRGAGLARVLVRRVVVGLNTVRALGRARQRVDFGAVALREIAGEVAADGALAVAVVDFGAIRLTYAPRPFSSSSPPNPPMNFICQVDTRFCSHIPTL